MEGLKHTKGPWRYEKGDEDCGYEGRHFVAWEGTECDETTICEPRYGEHDARLIAAAPEMLEALVCQYSWVKGLYDFYEIDETKYPRSYLIVTERGLRQLIERAAGMSIPEILASIARQDAER